MRSSVIIGALLGGAVVAVPLEQRAVRVVEVVDVVTVTLQPGQSAPTQAPVAPPPAPKPAPTTSAAPQANNGGGFLEGNAPSSAPAPAPAPAAPQQSSEPAPPPSSGLSSEQQSILNTVNYWRRAYDVQELSWDHSMDANIEQVGQNNAGVNEVHALIPGETMGQCITPGQSVMVPANAAPGYTPFDVAYWGWLCEVPGPQLIVDGQNLCNTMQSILHLNLAGETGHHAILVNPSWTTVSCGFTANPKSNTAQTYQGIWVCDYRNTNAP